MHNSSLKMALAAAINIAAVGAAHAHTEAPADAEKCVAVNKAGVNIIKKGRADCGSGKSICAGQNQAQEKDAWIMVPTGTCTNINQGNWQAVPKKICEKLDGVDVNNCKP